MINLEFAEIVRTIIALSIVYFPTVTFAGYTQAWLAKKLGDDTAEDFGYLTLNPAIHFDLFGFVILIFFQWGWGAPIPLDPHNIRGKWQKTRIAVLFMSSGIAYFIQAIAALLLLIVCGGFFLKVGLLQPGSADSSLFIALKFIIERYLLLNILLATLFFAYGIVRLLIFFIIGEDLTMQGRTSDIIFWILAILFVWVIYVYIHKVVLFTLIFLEILITKLCGF